MIDISVVAWKKQKPIELPGRDLPQSLGKDTLQLAELPTGCAMCSRFSTL